MGVVSSAWDEGSGRPWKPGWPWHWPGVGVWCVVAGADLERSRARLLGRPEERLWEEDEEEEDGDSCWLKSLGSGNGGDFGEVVCPPAVSIVMRKCMRELDNS